MHHPRVPRRASHILEPIHDLERVSYDADRELDANAMVEAAALNEITETVTLDVMFRAGKQDGGLTVQRILARIPRRVDFHRVGEVLGLHSVINIDNPGTR